VVVAVLAIFPVIGATLGALIAALVALASNGPASALAVIALAVAMFELEAHVLSPLVLGRTVRLHPLAVVLALAAGGVLLGLLGAFIAVPVAACAARAVGYLRGDREHQPAAAPRPRAPGQVAAAS
jgi:predicted PurR-regulated permease PerM